MEERRVQDRPQHGAGAHNRRGHGLTLVQLAAKLSEVSSAPGGTVEPIDAAAVSWFVRFHCDPPQAFDWTQFEAWIRAQRAHRRAYERVEQLWYGAASDDDGAPSPRSPVAPPSGPDGSGRVVRLRVAPHAPDQRPVGSRAVLGDGPEAEALIEGNIAGGCCFQPACAAEAVQALGPGL